MIDSGILYSQSIPKTNIYLQYSLHNTDINTYFSLYIRIISLPTYLMSIHESTLKNGSYFYITNRGANTQSQMALTYTSDSKHPQLCFKPLDQTSPDQVWMVEEIKSNNYELVHAYSTLVLSASKQSAWMAQGNWDANQLFFLQKSDPKNNPRQYWIKADKLSDLYLQYQGKIKVFQANPKASKCRWELKGITNKNEIFNSCLIQFAYSGLYVDLPQSSLKPGSAIVQYRLNSRCNQRWRFVRIKQSNDYLIMSVRSKMCLTVKGGKDKPGTHIIQQPAKNECPAQMWSLIHQDLSLYIIASKVKPNRFLGIDSNSMDEMSCLVLTNQEEYAFWRIIGTLETNQ